MKPGYTRRDAFKLLAAAVPSQLSFGAATAPRGIYPIVATPYTASNEIDYEDLEREVDFMDRCGAHGMVWPQLASEYRYLSRQERRRGMQVLARAAKAKRPALVLGVQASTKQDALEYAELAEELAPAAMIAIPPTEARSLSDVRDYYSALARVTKRPFFIQTSGGATGINPTVTFLIEMGQEFPNFGYVKEEHDPIYQRISELASARPAIKAVFSGPVGLYEMRVGCDGCMPEALYPDIDVQIWNLYHSGQQDKAREIFSKRLLMVRAAEEIPGTGAYIMKKRGVFKTALSRRVNVNLTQDAIRHIDFLFEALHPYLLAYKQ